MEVIEKDPQVLVVALFEALHRYEDSLSGQFKHQPRIVARAYTVTRLYFDWPSGYPSFTEHPTLKTDIKVVYALNKIRAITKQLVHMNQVLLSAEGIEFDRLIRHWTPTTKIAENTVI